MASSENVLQSAAKARRKVAIKFFPVWAGAAKDAHVGGPQKDDAVAHVAVAKANLRENCLKWAGKWEIAHFGADRKRHVQLGNWRIFKSADGTHAVGECESQGASGTEPRCWWAFFAVLSLVSSAARLIIRIVVVIARQCVEPLFYKNAVLASVARYQGFLKGGAPSFFPLISARSNCAKQDDATSLTSRNSNKYIPTRRFRPGANKLA